ncbi:helix-turn-helix transcriptional regulator [Fastidiosibacter lacustris]|uniref:helix-turn-helix transcriptional regulator n=1 Tax=Fastidiosibacter lacustris TaxID=2056695 RepID=UPI000E34DD2A|nr:AlpA family transcriptional regulator [Fastidiosibacter lacustris]
MNLNIIKLPLVVEKTSLSTASIYRLAKVGKFPAPVKLSERSSGWLESDVNQWIDNRIKARDGKLSKGV